jgi:hypothetical protein
MNTVSFVVVAVVAPWSYAIVGQRHWSGFHFSDLENCCWTITAALSSDSIARQAVVPFLVAAACLLTNKNRRSTWGPRNYSRRLQGRKAKAAGEAPGGRRGLCINGSWKNTSMRDRYPFNFFDLVSFESCWRYHLNLRTFLFADQSLRNWRVN